MKDEWSGAVAMGILFTTVLVIMGYVDHRHKQESLAAAKAERTASRLIKASARENSACRGSDDFTEHCARRDGIDRQLYRLGYCYGEGAEFGYQAMWRKCGEAAAIHEARASRRSNGLSASEQREADQLAAATRESALIQVEVERQLQESREADLERMIAVVEGIK